MWLLLSQITLAVEVPVDFPTIGDALLNVGPGGLIEVSTGQYAEDLVIAQDVTIRSLAGPEETHILGAGALTMISVTGGAVEIEGFTLDSGGTALNVSVTAGAELTLRDIDCKGGVAGPGPGSCLRVTGATATVEDSRFYGNTTGPAASGGHIGATTSTLSVVNSRFVGGDALYGGAIYAVDTLFDVDGSWFDGNTAAADGGAIYVSGGSSTSVKGGRFYDNVASGAGGGIHITASLAADIGDSVFVRNDATTEGGAVLVFGTPGIAVDSCIFEDNTAVTGWGGAVHLWLSDGATLSNSWFDDNNATDLRGGAAAIQTSPNTSVHDTAFLYNHAGGSSGALHVEGSSTSLIEGNLVCGNWTDGSGLDGIGADAGGFMIGTSDSSSVLNNLIVDNESSDDGGGVSNQTSYGPVSFRNNTVVSNISGDGFQPGAPNVAGNIRTSNGDIDILSNVITEAGDDGGVTLSYTSLVTNDYNHFYANTGGDFVGGPTLGPNDTTGTDPIFSAWLDDGDCHNDDFRPGVGSPLVNTGSPSFPDLDGSANDRGATGGPNGDIRWYDDGDGDGHPDRDDCDPDEAQWHPATTWYEDADWDGYGDVTTATTSCAPPGADWVLDATDCDDADGLVSPGGLEICNGVDDDCNGAVDDNPLDGIVNAPDTDNDGWGDLSNQVIACGLLAGHTDQIGDCDDTDPAVSPGALETCNGVDDDCDGLVDDDPTDQTEWFPDVDGDGWGDDTSDPILGCSSPTGFGPPGDCDDALADVSPDGIETCDDRDEDCDGEVDEDAIDPATWYPDADGDGIGDGSYSVTACDAPAGYVDSSGDCDDTDASVIEECDGAGRPWAVDGDTGAAKASVVGCDCSSDPSGTGPWLALFALAWTRRRRTRP